MHTQQMLLDTADCQWIWHSRFMSRDGNVRLSGHTATSQHGWTIPRDGYVRLPGFTTTGSTDLQQSGYTADLQQSGGTAWTGHDRPGCAQHVCFRNTFRCKGLPDRARLYITADARYEVYLNGQWLGQGPARSYPDPWPVDDYDVSSLLVTGHNVIAVLVQHWGVGTTQYVLGEPGLAAILDWEDSDGPHRLVTDSQWRWTYHSGYATACPRIALGMAWEEQFDARTELSGQPSSAGPCREVRLYACNGSRPRAVPPYSTAVTPPSWTHLHYDDANWHTAVVTGQVGQGVHATLEPRDIPHLTRIPRFPVRSVEAHVVSPPDYVYSYRLDQVIAPGIYRCAAYAARMLVATYIYTDKPQTIEFEDPHEVSVWPSMQWKLNGLTSGDTGPGRFGQTVTNWGGRRIHRHQLQRGWNVMLGRLNDVILLPRLVLAIRAEDTITISSSPNDAAVTKSFTGDTCPWLVLGPFAGISDQACRARDDDPSTIVATPVTEQATACVYERIWQGGTLTDADRAADYCRMLSADLCNPVDVFALCHAERTLECSAAILEDPSALCSDSMQWTTVLPHDHGDVRCLFDFGCVRTGFIEFEIDAPQGVILDGNCFEFIDLDGRYHQCEAINNTFRYITRQGRQHYCSIQRRGMRYCLLSIRNSNAPVKIRYFRLIESTYPFTRKGNLHCSDGLLEQIWHTGVQTVQTCSEDTYTDCPTYEQVLWTGDARNESLVDLVVNGDPRLSARSLRVVGRSLDTGTIVASHVPSDWKAYIPAWAFLWMRWCWEHYLHTGDQETAAESLAFLERNMNGIKKHLTPEGLFCMRAWNLFDWAPMDTPSDGIVTHNNCQLVLGLKDAARLARHNNRQDMADEWERMATDISAAINALLFSDDAQAYIDCIHADGSRSDVFSQQTQTAAYLAGVAEGARAQRCRSIIDHPPEGFIKAGSPFFMFFLLEVLANEGDFARMYEVIRHYWGRQIQAGATTFWEMYTPDADRLTRSFCHGWSAAPTYFLSQYLLGVRPADPGYDTVVIAPHPETISWATGSVATPRSTVYVQWTRTGDIFDMSIRMQRAMPTIIQLPYRGDVTIIDSDATVTITDEETPRITGSSANVQLRIDIIE